MPKRIDEQNLFFEVIRTIVQRGFAKATTKQIAEAAGINEVTLFRKYGTKAGLIQAAFQHIAATSPLKDLAYSGELEPDLIQIVTAYKKTSALYGEIIPLILAEIPHDPGLRELLKPFLAQVRSIMQILQKYQEDGQLNDEPGFSMVSALLGPLMVSQMIQKTDPELGGQETDARTYVKAFLEGRMQRPGR